MGLERKATKMWGVIYYIWGCARTILVTWQNESQYIFFYKVPLWLYQRRLSPSESTCQRQRQHQQQHHGSNSKENGLETRLVSSPRTQVRFFSFFWHFTNLYFPFFVITGTTRDSSSSSGGSRRDPSRAGPFPPTTPSTLGPGQNHHQRVIKTRWWPSISLCTRTRAKDRVETTKTGPNDASQAASGFVWAFSKFFFFSPFFW